MTSQCNVRLSRVSRDKLDKLTALYESQRVVIEIAIDRLYADLFLDSVSESNKVYQDTKKQSECVK